MRLLLTLILFSFFTTIHGQTLQLKSAEHDFEVIYEGEKVEHTFAYTNKGDAPLILSDVRLTCGCTAVSWDKTPLSPNESTEITIQFDSKGKVGRQRKVITLISNDKKSPTSLQLYGTVLPNE